MFFYRFQRCFVRNVPIKNKKPLVDMVFQNAEQRRKNTEMFCGNLMKLSSRLCRFFVQMALGMPIKMTLGGGSCVVGVVVVVVVVVVVAAAVVVAVVVFRVMIFPTN